MEMYNGDCLVEMLKIPDHSVDMILCDLPYGTTSHKWDVCIPFEPLWEQYWRVLKEKGAVVLFGSEPFSSYLRMSQIEHFKYDWIWVKPRASGFVNAKNKPLKSHEIISVFSMGTTVHASQSKSRMPYFPVMGTGEPYKKTNKKDRFNWAGVDRPSIQDTLVTTNDGVRYPRSVMFFGNPNNKSLHPTQKPVALLEYLIKTYTNEGETVLDNCMGSASTGIACLNTSRDFIGIEKDEKYFEICVERVENRLKELANA
jgi:site-specific DNA-methyltransferase (adenine-specific)